jgi:hypothetical protein
VRRELRVIAEQSLTILFDHFLGYYATINMGVGELVAQLRERGGFFYFTWIWLDPHTVSTLIKMPWALPSGLVLLLTREIERHA